MSRRIQVTARCRTRCPSCAACPPGQPDATLDEVVAAAAGQAEVVLGGGDASGWPLLAALCDHNRAVAEPSRLWVEAPAAALTEVRLGELRALGVHGVRVQIEAAGARMCAALGVGDGEVVIAAAEALGLQAEARVCVRPRTFAIVAPLAERLRPRTVWLEVVRQDLGARPTAIPEGALERLVLCSPNLRFTSHRLRGAGYLPPCVMPRAFARSPDAWQNTLADDAPPPDPLPACASCGLRGRCTFTDAGALSPEARRDATPLATPPPARRQGERAVPAAIVRRRPATEVVCVEPWTTMELSDPDGRVRQCGGNWTDGDRGNIFQQSLREIWNGEGYREARRLMGSAGPLDALCRPVCIRLYDKKNAERGLRIHEGSEAFVQNQLLLAEDIAERREVVRALPLHLTISPSTYCNYDCLFCDFGRTPRRDMPDSVWDELPYFLPTLQTLTLLGGEPLASPRVWHFLREHDTDRYPDLRIDIFTNGALMTEKALGQIRRCSLGEVTISLNAGTDDVYRAIERGVGLDEVVDNIDALCRYRAAQPFWFGITLSFIVQAHSAHTLIPFGQLAHERNLHIRLVALNVQNFYELNFYRDPAEVARVLAHLDAFDEWARRVRPEWRPQVSAVREAIVLEAARRQGVELVPLRRAANALPLRLQR